MKDKFLYQFHSIRAFVPLLICVAVFVGIAGCVKLERPTLDRKFYTLDVDRQVKEAGTQKSSKNLIVRRVKISPRYEDKDLVYKIGDNAFESDYYNSFFVPPASMITQELRVWMGKSKLFANVLGPDSMGTGELLLEGVVNSIYGDFSVASPKAILDMQFFLLDNGNPDMPIVYSRTFCKEIPVSSKGADALVKAMNIGLNEIFTELENDLAGIIEKNSYDAGESFNSQEK